MMPNSPQHTRVSIASLPQNRLASPKSTLASGSMPSLRFGKSAPSKETLETPDQFTSRQSKWPAGTISSPAAQQQLATELIHMLSADASGIKLNREQLLQAIQKGKKLPLPKGYRIEYAIIHPNGQVESPFNRARALLEPVARQPENRPRKPQPVLITIQTPQTNKALETFIEHVLKKEFAHSHKNPKSGITTNNVVLSDLIEKLISGHTDTGLPDAIRDKVLDHLSGNVADYQKLGNLYQITTPGNPELTRTLNNTNSTLRQKLIGLELARKVYAESQEVEWQSIALSLALGVIGEPTINHMFKEGGPVASAVRTGLMSGIDIMGNVLSVMGIVSENLKARNKKLSLETVYGPPEQRRLLKTLFNPQGEAGPDIKQGVKAGVLGGMLGVLFNIPAGSILSMPNADVAARSVVGGIGAAGSAVAIPSVIKDSMENFKVSIQALIDKGLIKLPESVKGNPAKTEKYIERLALKEMNARIGIASSIKATHPIPLAGLGAAILAAEKLGIPRPYVQTAYMAVAPVMHNFIRLGTTGAEKFWTIPQRMNTLEKLVLASEVEKDGKFNTQQLERMDKAFLSGQDQWLSKGLTQTAQVVLAGGLLLTAEVLYFSHALQQEKQAKAEKPAHFSGGQSAFDPHHYQFSTAYTGKTPFQPSTDWNRRNHPATYYPHAFQQAY